MTDAIDEVPIAEEPSDGRPHESVDDAALHAEYRRLVAEQNALRRIATLVARGAEPSEVFDAVTHEIRRCVRATTAGLWRFETSEEIMFLAGAAELAKWPVGTRTPIDGDHLAAAVERTGKAARIDDFEKAIGPIAGCVRAVGVRVAVGVPVIVDGRVWGMAAVGSAGPGHMPADNEARISRFGELVATALVAGYRDEQKRQLLDETSNRPCLIDSLLHGRIRDTWSLWEIASHLRLPRHGPFVVIAAEALTVGSEALPDIESKLRSLDVYSAWQRLPDAQVGIVHVSSDHQFEKVLALVSRTAAGRVGVSARFDDLRDTPQALHCAKVSLRGRADRTSQVAVFDGSILATAAISAPEMMIKSAGTALDGFSELPDEQRRILFDTFRVWQENDASVNAVAERLTCHPNTVRHRLRRIEKHTGRSLSRPRDLAELCLAFEVHRRLFEPKPRGCENDRCLPVWCGDIFLERHRVSNPIKQMGDKRGEK
jgi:sugar diacid utilization regulator